MRRLTCEKCGQIWYVSNKHDYRFCDFCGSYLTEKTGNKIPNGNFNIMENNNNSDYYSKNKEVELTTNLF